MWLPQLSPWWTIEAARAATTTERASLTTCFATSPAWHGVLRNASWSCNGCTDLAMQILHDDDDDDGEVYFSGKRSVKRSRCPRSHGWRSRRLKSAASVRQAGQCVQTFGHCWKRPLKAKERRNVGQEAQSCTTPATHQRCRQTSVPFAHCHS